MKRKYQTVSPEEVKSHQGQRNRTIQEMLNETAGVNVTSLINNIEKKRTTSTITYHGVFKGQIFIEGNQAVPKMSHPSICGPKNENVDKQIKETGAKMNVLPLRVRENEMVISGEKDGVIIKQKVEVMGIYMEEKKNKIVSVEVRKSQHKYRIGPGYSGLHEIFKETRGAVEVPSLYNIENITLTREQDKLGPALTMVYSKGNRAVPKMSHPSICGPKNENVDKQIKETGAKMNVLPLRVRENEMVISGEKDGVIIKQKVEVVGIYMEEKKNKIVSVEVRKSQHKYRIGPGYSGLHEIFKETRGAVEVPSLYNIENITLTREQDKLGPALTMVYSKGNRAVPKMSHPSICGPKNENVDKQIKETGAKMNVLPLRVRENEMVISGEKDGVIIKQKVKVMGIYMEEKKNKIVSVEVRKSQHKYRTGPGYSGLHEIFKETRVAVEVPSLYNIENITLTREQDKLGPALTMVYSKGNRAVPKMSHPSICGPKNENVDEQIKETGAKMNVLPLRVRENEMVISGEKDGVIIKQKVEAVGIYMEEKRNKIVSVEVGKSQHKYRIGPGYSGLHEIFKETRVAVEVPSLYNILNITMTREQDKLGPALTMVYSKVHIKEEFKTKMAHNQHNWTIGVQGRFVKSIAGGCDDGVKGFDENDGESTKKHHQEFTNEKVVSDESSFVYLQDLVPVNNPAEEQSDKVKVTGQPAKQALQALQENFITINGFDDQEVKIVKLLWRLFVWKYLL
ncbi:unnamed protein product [Mytilus coruscus]|uniref:Uncharacterized protein n=1 Tax=Mytilus coruscus TaxID=42192 RepID=A0A6J8A1Q6_MYTCO|nr:unnamed protein product [Mytilus coruscus]